MARCEQVSIWGCWIAVLHGVFGRTSAYSTSGGRMAFDTIIVGGELDNDGHFIIPRDGVYRVDVFGGLSGLSSTVDFALQQSDGVGGWDFVYPDSSGDTVTARGAQCTMFATLTSGRSLAVWADVAAGSSIQSKGLQVSISRMN